MKIPFAPDIAVRLSPESGPLQDPNESQPDDFCFIIPINRANDLE